MKILRGKKGKKRKEKKRKEKLTHSKCISPQRRRKVDEIWIMDGSRKFSGDCEFSKEEKKSQIIEAEYESICE